MKVVNKLKKVLEFIKKYWKIIIGAIASFLVIILTGKIMESKKNPLYDELKDRQEDRNKEANEIMDEANKAVEDYYDKKAKRSNNK